MRRGSFLDPPGLAPPDIEHTTARSSELSLRENCLINLGTEGWNRDVRRISAHQTVKEVRIHGGSHCGRGENSDCPA
jgi:hypothetical protein